MHSLLDWYRTGEDIDRRMPLLSTYLGHADPASCVSCTPRPGKQPFVLDINDVDAPLIGALLTHLEAVRTTRCWAFADGEVHER